jgi:ABC-type Na+ efflux pump permease subunit
VRPSEPRLPEPWTALLLAVFGAATCASILAFGGSGAGSLDLLALGASLGAIAVAGVWLFLIATAQSRAWAVAFAATFWIPYVNLVVASVFARRYWERGARAPALLVLLPDLTPPV